MKYMNTKDMIDIALKLAGEKECPADSGVIVPGENIKKVLAGLEINNAELVLAKVMGYDCVVGQHTRTTDLKGCSKLMEDLPYKALIAAGLPALEAQKAVSGRTAKADDNKHAINYNREVSAAEVLGLPFICISSLSNTLSEQKLQKHLDKYFADKPLALLSEVLAALQEFPEYDSWTMKPEIIVGEPESHAGKIVAVVNGLVEGGLPDPYVGLSDDSAVLKAFFKAGVGTLIVPSIDEATEKTVKEQKIGNLIVAGHMPVDSIGINAIIAEWEKQGVKVDKFCGILG